MTRFLLGFDIGGTKSAVALGDGEGSVIDRVQVATGDWRPTLDQLVAAASGLLETHEASPTRIGVSVGSPIDRKRGLICAPANLPHWQNVPIAHLLQEAFDAPVNLENDADAAAVAEWRFGHRAQPGSLIYLTCGTGQGAGLVLDGALYRGAANLAGEIGHVRLTPMGPVGCKKAGSVEGLTAGKALGVIAQMRLAEKPGATVLGESPIASIDSKAVAEAAAHGDRFARNVVLELAGHLGRTCAILMDVLNPEQISLGSLGIRLAPIDGFLPAIREAACAEAMPGTFAACTIAPAALGHEVQDLAALAAATL